MSSGQLQATRKMRRPLRVSAGHYISAYSRPLSMAIYMRHISRWVY